MRTITFAATSLIAIVAATVVFYLFQHELTSFWVDVNLRPEVREALEQSRDDQKKLRTLDRENSAHYRARFESLQRLIARMDVLALSRRELVRRYEVLLVSIFAATVIAAAIFSTWRYRRDERRLGAIQSGLMALSRGDAAVDVGDRRRDVIGRIGRMIEETARMVAGQRQRLAALEHLSSWQEAARRHAHEIRTPLTAAQLEIDRLVSLSLERAPADQLQRTRDSVLEELDRLSRFTREFSSFARIGEPVLREVALDGFVEEFCRAFEKAWPLTFRNAKRVAQTFLSAQDGQECLPHTVMADRDQLRQVLVNLCTNAAQAGARRVRFVIADHALDVIDDGPGIDASIRPRLFQPYATTRPVGEGMGLGLAISRKIMLDHQGDLELVSSSPTTFRLLFPRAAN